MALDTRTAVAGEEGANNFSKSGRFLRCQRGLPPPSRCQSSYKASVPLSRPLFIFPIDQGLLQHYLSSISTATSPWDNVLTYLPASNFSTCQSILQAAAIGRLLEGNSEWQLPGMQSFNGFFSVYRKQLNNSPTPNPHA